MESLLQNTMFQKRYIRENVNRKRDAIKGKRGIARVFRGPVSAILKHFYLKNYFENRVKKGFVDIPYIELVLTTKCTMRCESCNNLMQYFSPKAQYTCTLEGMINSLETLCKKVDSIQMIRLIGGEPFLFKDLDGLLDYLENNKKILSFDIVTNASVDIKESTLKRFKKSKKILNIAISDYSHVSGIILKQDSIFKNLKKHKIPYNFLTGGSWFSVGHIFKRNRSKDEIIKNFRACGMQCVSLMSGECISKADIIKHDIRKDKEAQKEANRLAPNGALFVCPVASSLSRLRGLEEFASGGGGLIL
ncbi:MAG: 4Fe-4S cluster-binding domain-containing protein [Helicobacter sp.]|nr:4Fe-4S cluster-binding domain-containing protein [Helicobacter sp.]